MKQDNKGKARFIGGDLFWSMLLAYRVVWYMGRYGAGKTSLAVICAARLLAEKRVERVVSNIPLSFYDPVKTTDTFRPLENAAILLDEAWIYLDSRSSVLEYAGFVRKFNHYLLLPSVFPVHPRLSYFYVQRVFNGYSVGLPVWFYKWSINNKGIKEDGHFGIINPRAVFGHYPTDFVPGDDGNISDLVNATAKNAGYKGTRADAKRTTKKQKSDKESIDTFHDDIQTMEDAAYQMEEAKEDIKKISRTLRRTR